MIDSSPPARLPGAVASSAPAARTRLVRPSDLDSAELAAWSRLADAAAEPNPFLRPEFVLAAGEASGDPLLLVVSEGDDWIGCLTLRRARRWRRLRLPLLVAALTDHSYCATPLVDGERVEQAVAGLAGFVAAERRAAAVVIDPLSREGVVGPALIRALAERGRPAIEYELFERAALRHRPDGGYLDGVSRKRLKEMRRLKRSLGRELEAPVEVVDRASDPAADDTFLALEADGWKGEAGTALGSDPATAAFFQRMCRAMAMRGMLQMLALECGGRTAAMQCNLVDADGLFCFKVAYDRRLARFSPGALLELEAIDAFHDRLPGGLADSCAAPDNELINRLWPDRIQLASTLLPTAAPAALLVRPAIAVERAGRRLLGTVRPRPS